MGTVSVTEKRLGIIIKSALHEPYCNNVYYTIIMSVMYTVSLLKTEHYEAFMLVAFLS